MQQVIYIHGGDVHEDRDRYLRALREWKIDDPTVEHPPLWSRRLQEDLGPEFQVISPVMPNKMNATYEEWKIWFEKYIPYLRGGMVCIGWSLGANFLAKYLSEQEFPIRISSLHLVAGCFGAQGGFELENVTVLCRNIPEITIYHSNDDPVVSFKDALAYRDALPCAKLVEFDGRGHFLQEQFPELLKAIKSA